MKSVKQTQKQVIQTLREHIRQVGSENDKLRNQMVEQNTLMARLEREGNALVDKYNKLAGRLNSIRTLVTSND